ncbi:MAG: type II secretion system F family protein [Planctomycetaceae bacterium]|nr:type II secretion system F family protein [Planctomycetaceae bacterium]
MSGTLSPSKPLSSSEVVALCQELRDVIRAGVPLHAGIASAGAFSPRVATALEQLATRVEQGVDLADAVEEQSSLIPPVLRGIVTAGLRSGRLDELLDDLSTATQELDRLRGVLMRGLIYPLFVVLLSAVLANTVLPVLLDWLEQVFETVPDAGWAHFVLQNAWLIKNLGWIVLGGLVGLWMSGVITTRMRGEQLSGWSVFAIVPPLQRVVEDSRLARVVHLLSLLVKYGVPLPEALRLASATTDNNQLAMEFSGLAEHIANGGNMADHRFRRIPRFLQWMFSVGNRDSRLSETLLEAATYYRQRAIHGAELVARIAPSIVLVFLGGGFTLLYALIIYGPLTDLWTKLGAV